MRPYTPTTQEVLSGDFVTFDGTEGDTDSAIIVSFAANFDAKIIYEAADGVGTWQQISTIGSESGDPIFTAEWHSQGNRFLISKDSRRIKIENVDTVSGWIAVDGDMI